MNDFRRGRGNAGQCSFSPLRTGWEGWMFRHFPRPIIDLSPALNNHQASTGIELWALQSLRQEVGQMVLASQLSHLLNGDKELAQDHTHPWGQSRESHLAYFHIQVRGRAQLTSVLWRCPYIGFMLVLFSVMDACGQKALELPHAAPHVRSVGCVIYLSLSKHTWQIQNQKCYSKHANSFVACFIHINAHVPQEKV